MVSLGAFSRIPLSPVRLCSAGEHLRDLYSQDGLFFTKDAVLLCESFHQNVSCGNLSIYYWTGVRCEFLKENCNGFPFC